MGQSSYCCCNKEESISQNKRHAKAPVNQYSETVTHPLQCYDLEGFGKNETDLLQEGYICAICECVLKEAVRDKCGHVFGKKCIEEWMKVNSTCPFSREPLSKCDLRPDNQIRENVNKMKADYLASLDNKAPRPIVNKIPVDIVITQSNEEHKSLSE